jgi:hypothetical protein
VGGVLIIHIDDLRHLAPYWLHKTEEVRADKEHYATNITGDIYQQGWISEMYGYSFGAAEVIFLAWIGRANVNAREKHSNRIILQLNMSFRDLVFLNTTPSMFSKFVVHAWR